MKKEILVLIILLLIGVVSAHPVSQIGDMYSFENNSIVVDETLEESWSSNESQTSLAGVQGLIKNKIISYLDKEGIKWLILLLFFAFILGIIHTFTPGHGKSVIASYLVGERATVKDAIVLSLTTATTHILDVIIVMVIFFFILKSTNIDKYANYLYLISASLIIIFALYGSYGAVKNFLHMRQHQKEHSHTHSHSHEHTHQHNSHSNHHHPHHTKKSFLLGIFLGLAPCPMAWAIFLLAIGIGKYYLGFLMIFAFGIGIILTMLTLSLLILKFKSMVKIKSSVTVYLQVLAYILIFILGIYMLSSGLGLVLAKDSSADKIQSLYDSGFEIQSCEQITETDIYELCKRIRNKDSEEFDSIMFANAFTGNINPYTVCGAKMGVYAKRLLDGKEHQINVLTETGTKVPLSYINDGIMASTGSTFGKGLIKHVPDSNTSSAIFFYENKSVRIELKPEIAQDINQKILESREKRGGITYEYLKDTRNIALDLWEKYTVEETFIIIYPNKDGAYCHYNDYTINEYFNMLAKVVYDASSDAEILKLIDEHECVYNGNVYEDEWGQRFILVTWKSNNQQLTFFY